MKKLISRCNFLKMGALASAVMMLAACGWLTLLGAAAAMGGLALYIRASAVPEAEKIRVPM